jgi:thiamine biosynthesis lipoprotein
MGTYITVTVYPPKGVGGRDAAERAFDAIAEVDRLMSDYKADSELSEVNRSAGRRAVPVSQQTYECIRRALEIAEASGGAFDPTVRPLVQMWKEAGKKGKLPDPDAVARTHALVNWRHVQLVPPSNDKPPRVMLTEPGMELDLGGIAKGYSTSRAAAALKEIGVRSALVAAAGDIYALGTHPDGKPWVVAIQDPSDESRWLPDSLLLTDRAVSTSGDYRRFVEIEGHRYSHIIDPHTGEPVEHIASVTVVASDPTDADALATTLSVLGPDKGMAFVKRFADVEAMMVVRDPAGRARVVKSDGFDELASLSRRQ